MKKIGLRLKLIVGGILLVLLPLTFVGIFAVVKSSDALLERGKAQSQIVASEIASKMNLVLEEELKFAQSIASETHIKKTIEKVDSLGVAESESVLKDVDRMFFNIFKDHGKNYENIALVDANGIVIADNTGSLREKKISLKERPYFNIAKKGSAVISDPVKSKVSGNPISPIAVPLKSSEGKFAGVFLITLKINVISDKVKTRFGKTGYSLIVNKKGVLIGHPVKKYILKLSIKDSMAGIAMDMLSGKSGVDIYTFNGEEKICGYAPVKATGWSVGVTQNTSEFMESVYEIRYLVLIAGFVSVLLAIVCILFFSNRIMVQLGDEPGKIASIARRISVGDLTLEFSRKSSGVYGNMKVMTENLFSMIKNITEGVNLLSSSSSELSAVSEQITSNSRNTSDRSGQVASAAEKMSLNMQNVAASTEQTTNNIQMIATAIEEMSSTINEIALSTSKGSKTTSDAVSKAKEISTKVDNLGVAATEINKVTDVISDISEQTNLLALNATIEAARAGEAGKGFAVVAGEIKSLAHQTSEATKEISLKTSDVQKTTDESIEALKNIVEIINEIDSIVSTVAISIEEQSATTEEISKNVAQAADGVHDVHENINKTTFVAEEVSSNIQIVNDATNEVNEGSLQVSKSSLELSKLSEQLNEMIREFRLK